MTREEQIEVIEEIAEEMMDVSVYSNYSGRGMYGSTCVGIEGSNYIEIIEEAASRGIRGARVDNMGLDYIVYWPDISLTDAEVSEMNDRWDR